MKRGLIIFVLLVLSISYLSAANHSASNIFVNIGATKTNLDSSASNFIGTHTYSSVSSLAPGEHDASSVLVRVKGGEMNLLQALQSTDKLCPPSSAITSYAGNINPGHKGTEIILSSEKTLQKAIDDGDFCSTGYSWYTGDWGYWSSETCSGSKTRTVYCKRNSDSAQVANSYCSGDKPSAKKCHQCTWQYQSYMNGAAAFWLQHCSEFVGYSCSNSELGTTQLCIHYSSETGAGCFLAWCTSSLVICSTDSDINC